jgi:hypothetical protein
MTNARVQKGEKHGAVRGSIRCSAVCGLDLCSLVVHTPEGGGVALVLRLFVGLQVARQISMRQKKVHCTVLAGSMPYGSTNVRGFPRVVAVVRLFVSLQGGRAISVISVISVQQKEDESCCWIIDTNGKSWHQLQCPKAGPGDYSCSRKRRLRRLRHLIHSTVHIQLTSIFSLTS